MTYITSYLVFITGGGDAKAAHLELHTIVDDTTVITKSNNQSVSDIPNKKSTLSQILWPLGKSIGLRNIKLPGTTAIADSMQYFSVSSATRISSVDPHRHTPYYPQSTEIAKWLQNGFNATVINYGPKYKVKESTIFGPRGSFSSLQQPIELSNYSKNPTFVSEVLRQLYKPEVEDYHLYTKCTIAISMWYLQNTTVVDVCESKKSKQSTAAKLSSDDEGLDKEWLQFACVECPDFETAMRVIQTGRSRCPQNDEYHVFLRVLLFRSSRTDETEGSLSHMHLVDLVNASQVDNLEHRKLPTEENRISRR